ncbi:MULTISPECIES: DUF5667 domain-containing protein [Actinoplanes]|uniref:DUF5667 domain-containing protein n=1 Tax=Actinoplanes sp. NBRC 101535 TaxID=3032196 RepID=UPI0005F2E2C2|nr:MULTISPECIES: DUF5667 domain-containing protein [Actinoplanes]GLY03298.1 hypothetical protein Acsp01_36770 [Actinoplanes sp. NBRC 101535]
MKFAFPSSRRAERFAELIDDAHGARRHHTRGPADEELDRLVAIGNRLTATRPGASVDAEFRVGLRSMLVAAAEREGIGQTAVLDPDPSADFTTGARRPLFGRRIRARGAIVIGVAAGAMAVSGISAASESASPGDALYGVKRSTERAQLAIAGSDVTRGQLSLDFARTRLTEALAMAGDAPQFTGVLDDMDADTRKGVRLLTTSSVAHRDVKPLITLDGFVDNQRKAFGPALERLAPVNRERAVTSLELLEQVGERTEALRIGLSCDKPESNGSDQLGPKLHDCAGGPATGSGSAKGSSGTGKTQQRPATEGKSPTPKPVRTGAGADPDASGDVTTPDDTDGTVGTGTDTDRPDVRPTTGKATVTTVPPTATTVPTTPPAYEEPAEKSNGGVLGGLLDDLF